MFICRDEVAALPDLSALKITLDKQHLAINAYLIELQAFATSNCENSFVYFRDFYEIFFSHIRNEEVFLNRLPFEKYKQHITIHNYAHDNLKALLTKVLAREEDRDAGLMLKSNISSIIKMFKDDMEYLDANMFLYLRRDGLI